MLQPVDINDDAAGCRAAGDRLGRQGQYRLTPERVSLKRQAMTFIRDYIAAAGGSPSYGEIANALGVHRVSVLRLVRALVREGELLQIPGQRGLVLPDQRDEARRVLERMGFTVIAPEGRGGAAAGGEYVTNRNLTEPPLLDYPFSGADGDGDGGEGTEIGQPQG